MRAYGQALLVFVAMTVLTLQALTGFLAAIPGGASSGAVAGINAFLDFTLISRIGTIPAAAVLAVLTLASTVLVLWRAPKERSASLSRATTDFMQRTIGEFKRIPKGKLSLDDLMRDTKAFYASIENYLDAIPSDLSAFDVNVRNEMVAAFDKLAARAGIRVPGGTAEILDATCRWMKDLDNKGEKPSLIDPYTRQYGAAAPMGAIAVIATVAMASEIARRLQADASVVASAVAASLAKPRLYDLIINQATLFNAIIADLPGVLDPGLANALSPPAGALPGRGVSDRAEPPRVPQEDEAEEISSAPAEVWISTSFLNSAICSKLRVMRHDRPGIDETQEEMEQLAALARRYESGEGLPERDIPRRFCGRNPDTRIRPLSHFFYANSFFVVSESCAQVFRQFDLGTGGLHPVEIYQGNRKTRVEGSFFLLDFGCRKQAFMPEHSDSFHLSPIDRKNPTLWLARNTTGDDECAVSRAALEGADLWIDPTLKGAFFVSDRLVQALRAAKVTRTIRLRRCRVLEI